MKYLFFVSFAFVWGLGSAQNSTSGLNELLQGAKTVVASAVNAVSDTARNSTISNIIAHNCVEPPAECPNENITFWYYSRSNPDAPIQISVANPQSLDSLQQNGNPWKIMIHGYTKSKDEIPNPQLRSAYFQHGEYNLISVDYAPIARDGCYIHAVKNVPLIANCTAQLIDAMMERNYFSSSNLHVIGFSLGGQIAGSIYEYLKHEKPFRVTGLDPASPLFDGVINHKLTKNSGNFVDVIHTNALLKGKLEASGHVDFYVNGGISQPGCLSDTQKSFSTCSHDRSPLYYAESINSQEGFWGIPCPNYFRFFSKKCEANESDLILMGEYVPLTARGLYYLQTTDKEPYALGRRVKYD